MFDITGKLTQTGRNTVEPRSGTANATLNFTVPITGFTIYNGHTADLTVTVGSDTFKVFSDLSFDYDRWTGFTTVTVAATGPWLFAGLR